jgi:hypothetical protein
MKYYCRDEILGHQVNKRLESFDQCYLRLLLLAERKKTKLFSGFKNPGKKSAKKENYGTEKTQVYAEKL